MNCRGPMKFFAIAAVATLLATVAQAQPGPGGSPPNPDADRDGKVTLAEFKAAQGERQGRMFSRMDSNKDGKVTQAEVDAVTARAEASGGQPRGDGPRRGPGGGLMRLDVNKDGAVTLAEMGAMTQQRFDMADTNKDGWLSKGELLMMQQRMRGPGSE